MLYLYMSVGGRDEDGHLSCCDDDVLHSPLALRCDVSLRCPLHCCVTLLRCPLRCSAVMAELLMAAAVMEAI
jgi:hypothetical protein